MSTKPDESFGDVLIQKLNGILVGTFLGGVVVGVPVAIYLKPGFSIVTCFIGVIVGGTIAGRRIGPIGSGLAVGSILAGVFGVLTFVEEHGERLFFGTAIGALFGFSIGVFVEWSRCAKKGPTSPPSDGSANEAHVGST
ncbi:MAG: hypothetical protein HY040_18715 [Planctomycetes bacterium]|nr:hypothetical protein [Planctomycetota bacterium]